MRKHFRLLGFIAAVILSVLVFIYRGNFLKLQGYGYFGLFILSILGNATIILPIPVILSAFVAGAVFNPLIVSLIVATGATIGELTGYLAGYGSTEIIEKDAKLKVVKKWMDRYGLWTLFILAAIPNPLFDLAGIVAGATRISVKKYFLVVWFGKFIKFGVLSFLGAGSVGLIDKYI